MIDANTMVTALLIVSATGAVCHHASSQPATTTDLHTFLRTEGQTCRVPSVAHRKPARRPARPVLRPHGPVYTVTATTYHAVPGQTDEEPFVTADNSTIKPNYSSRLRWLAVSQDLLAHCGGRIQYGDQVQVSGVSDKLDGLYTVHDTMNRRHRHCIDILSNPGEKIDLFLKGVKLQKIEKQLPLALPRLAGRRSRLFTDSLFAKQLCLPTKPAFVTASLL